MSSCVMCGMQVNGSSELCYHHTTYDLGWAIVNRIMCDLIHRGIQPTRLSKKERDDDFVASNSDI